MWLIYDHPVFEITVKRSKVAVNRKEILPFYGLFIIVI